MDKHLQILAKQHVETKFIKVSHPMHHLPCFVTVKLTIFCMRIRLSLYTIADSCRKESIPNREAKSLHATNSSMCQEGENS